jgi:hypothetical protein
MDSMNVITPADKMHPSGSNMKSAIDDVVDELARTIIMIETGRRHFVGTTIVKDPEPMFVKQLGYCTVNMYVRNSNLIILVPYGIDFATCVALLIGRVNDRIHDFEAALRLGDVMIRDDNVFARIDAEYTRTIDSLIMPKGQKNQVMKRIFVLAGSTVERNLEAAFRWDIRNYPDQLSSRQEACWFADKADIYVNFIGAPLDRFTSHAQMSSIRVVLRHLNAKKIIVYRKERSGHSFVLENEPEYANRFSVVTYESNMSDAIRITHDDTVVKHAKKFMHLRRCADAKDDIPGTMSAVDFFDAFMECKHELGARVDVCQMCLKPQCGSMFALKKTVDQMDEYAAVCRRCLDDQVFANASKNTWITVVKYMINIPFSDVCEARNIPKQHALLYESDNFNNSHFGYVRDATAMAFNTDHASITAISAIVKFIDQVPDGEFIIFE